MQRKMTVEEVARAVYEVHAAYAPSIGEKYDAWEEAPPWKLRPLLVNVARLIRNPAITPELLHELWMAEKAHDGWRFGPEKDAEAKTHPLMVPWGQVPEHQRMKDVILWNVVATLRPVADIGGTGTPTGDTERASNSGPAVGQNFAGPVHIATLNTYQL